MRKSYILIGVCLFFSLFIYLFYRTEKTLINELSIQVLSVHHYSALREAVTGMLPLSKPIIFSLPEGLWVFCITLTSKPFYLQWYQRQLPGVFVPLIFCISLELFQLLQLTKGRFDFLDIGVSVFFWALAHYGFTFSADKQNILSPLTNKSLLCFASYGIVYLAHVLE